MLSANVNVKMVAIVFGREWIPWVTHVHVKVESSLVHKTLKAENNRVKGEKDDHKEVKE